MKSLTCCYNFTSVPQNNDGVNFCWKWEEVSIQEKERTFFKLLGRKSNRMQQLIDEENEFSKFSPEFATEERISEYQRQVLQIYFKYEGWGKKKISLQLVRCLLLKKLSYCSHLRTAEVTFSEIMLFLVMY